MPTNPTLTQMESHRSIRDFKPAPIPQADLERAITAAQMASTSSYVQAYSVLNVTTPETRATLAELCGNQPQVQHAGNFLIILGDVHRHALIAQQAGTPLARNLESFLIATIDASLFAQNLALALESQNYGICFIGGLRNNLPKVDELLNLPQDTYPLFGMAAGTPTNKTNHTPRPRLPLKAILHNNHYPNEEELINTINNYDQKVATHYESRGQKNRNWTGGLTRRLKTEARENLAPYYKSKGAQLT